MNKVELDDIFEISDGRYVTLEETNLDGVRYIFTNKLNENEEPTKEFIVFEDSPNGLIKRTQKSEKLEKVLKIFSNKINEKLVLINETLNKGSE